MVLADTRRPCPVCGQDLVAPPGSAYERCPNLWCRQRRRAFSVAFSLGLHQGDLRGAITRYKYRGERGLAVTFAGMIASCMQSNPLWFEEFDLVTGVPSYIGPGARRDWDPVADVLSALASRIGHSWEVAPRVVVKQAETPCMTGLCRSARRWVARGPLRAALDVPDPAVVAGSQILVIDDVLTEGSTLGEVAGVLRRAGASDVAGLVIARRVWARAPSRRAAVAAGAPAPPPTDGACRRTRTEVGG